MNISTVDESAIATAANATPEALATAATAIAAPVVIAEPGRQSRKRNPGFTKNHGHGTSKARKKIAAASRRRNRR